MRLPLEQVKAGLLHEDKNVRSLALRYFGRGSVGEESVTATAMAAIERFGREEAFDYLWPLANLPHTSESVEWSIRQLEGDRVTDPFGREELVRILLSADPQLTSSRRDEILSIEELPELAATQFKLCWEIESWSSERLWNEIRAICEEGKAWDCADDFRFGEAEWMIDTIGRRGEPFPEWGLAVLVMRIPKDAWEGNPNVWMWPLLARLAGRLRYEPAVDALLADFHEDDEVGNEASQAALVQIGTDEVVAKIRSSWDEAPMHFQSCALEVLSWIRSDAAVAAIVELLPSLKVGWLIEHLTAAKLVDALSTEANEAVLRYLVEHGYADEAGLLGHLAASCELLGQELPGLRELLAQAVEKNEDPDRLLMRALEEFRIRMDRLGDREAMIELDEDEQLPPVDSFVVGPIRVTKTAGRNDPCPCGSGRKFKKCCWGQSATAETEASAPL